MITEAVHKPPDDNTTIVDEYVNKDRSREIQVYKKVGVVAMLANDICCYVDTSLLGNMTTWNYSNNRLIKDYTGVING